VQNYLHVIDGKLTGTFTNVAAANGAGGFNDFNEIYASGLAYSNSNFPVFQTRSGSNTTILTGGIRPNFTSRTLSPSFGPLMRPMVSDNDKIAIRLGNTGTSSIAIFTRPGLLDLFPPPLIVAGSSDGFSQIGQSPSISKFDEAVAFYADLNQTGATTLGTNPGPGIFVSIKLVSGQRKIVRIAGRTVEDISAPGGDDDGVCEAGETCVSSELGFNQAGNPINFALFNPDSRIDVAYISSGQPGIKEDMVMVSFIATPNIASDIPGRLFSNQQGLWTQEAAISLDDGTINSIDLQKADPVAQINDVINGNTLTGISVYDQIANNTERVAFWASSATGNMIVRAVRDVGTPVIFVAGVGGSELRHPTSGERLWFPETIRDDVTPLAIDNPVKVPDVMRKFKVGLILGLEQEQKVYDSLLAYFKDSGYTEYDLGGNEDNRGALCGAATQQDLDAKLPELRAKSPKLFVFPYDWRKTNSQINPDGSDGNTRKLRDYIQCVRQIYPDTQVNIVAHSMGGLLSRKYITENPSVHNVNTLVTIGSPWLGAPRAMHSLETGSFLSEPFPNGILDNISYWIPDALFATQIKQIIEGFPGAHELLPSQAYFGLGGRPLRVDGVDYTYEQVRDWINSRHSNFNPATNGANFHSTLQDDFRNDLTGVKYYHIYGKQPANRTVGQIESRKRLLLSQAGSTSAVYDQIYATATEGDGTVPIVSSSRRVDTTDGLNATCGTANDSRCIGVCYSEDVDSRGELSQHNGMTGNPQVQSQILQILRFTDGFITQNPGFGGDNCHLTDSLAPTVHAQSHYVTTTGIKNVLITDAQGNDNSSVSTAYKKLVPGVSELIVGADSMQIMTR